MMRRRIRNHHDRGPAEALLTFVLALLWSAPTRADRYEATVNIRPEGMLARVDDVGVRSPVIVPGAGLSAGLSWGVQNWLDVGGEVTGIVLAPARYERATADVFGNPHMGELSRTTRAMQLRGLATLRLGVGWVPTIQAAIGLGARQRTAARLVYGSEIVIPDGEEAQLSVDAIVGLRVGLEHRLTRRWSVGLSTSAAACIGIGTPGLQLFGGSIRIAYTWYPLW